ncbi:hypothetical protein NL676_034258 [Syzygium grande]|nr:hypothetical protein NL676_034258 [Syzygium grande]
MNVVSWTIMVAGYARNGMRRQALSVFDEMRRLRVELDQVALVAALSACSELGNLKLGGWIHSYVVEKIRARNQQSSITLNNAIIHMYASCGSIDEAYEVFKKMPRRSTASWTTVIIGLNGILKLQIQFVAGDKSHKHTLSIHEMLRKVIVQAESGGDRPDASDEALCAAA